MRRPHPTESRIREVVQYIQQLIDGRNNAGGSVTLTANAASTTISKTTINENAGFFAFPATANAAAELGAGTMHAAVTAGLVTITHANSAQTDRTFHYVILGG